jgi:hypothetical protein
MLLAVCFSAVGCSRTPPQASADRPYVCRSDFDRARELVEHSYAGYRDKLERLGPATILTATRLTAERTSGLSTDDPACTAALDAWLGVLADGHLFVRDLDQQGMRRRPASRRSEPEVTFRLVSGVAVLRIQTFEDADAVADVVQQHRGELTSAERLIIDLRGNGGGSDAAFAHVRSAVLPTRRRSLFWPTSRSRRLPEQPLDGAGIPPEVRLDPERLSQLDTATMIGIATDVRNPP